MQARNCGGSFGHKKFAFNIGKIKDRTDLEDKIVYECPRGIITDFEAVLWRAYNDTRFKAELGVKSEKLSAIKFEAFKILEAACNEFHEWKREEENKKLKRGSRGRSKN